MTSPTLTTRTTPILKGTIPWKDFVMGVQRWEDGIRVAQEFLVLPEMAAPLERGVSVAICTYRRPASLNRLLDSIALQQRRPVQLVIVDASPDDETERSLEERSDLSQIADRVLYLRVGGPLRGLTRQRNLALRMVDCDLVAFFDDDMVLTSGCLLEMERPHRDLADQVVGVAGMIENQCARPGLLWRVRRLLGIVSSLNPGDYCRSGLSVSWNFVPRTATQLIEGRWLQGGATMWNTDVVRGIGFHEGFQGYSSGEDLEFSLQAGRQGRLLLASTARMSHLHDSSGRPDAYMMGYMGLKNMHQIQRTCLSERSWRDAVWFVYAYGLDTLIRTLWLVYPRETGQRVRFLRGRLTYFAEMMWHVRPAIPGMSTPTCRIPRRHAAS